MFHLFLRGHILFFLRLSFIQTLLYEIICHKAKVAAEELYFIWGEKRDLEYLRLIVVEERLEILGNGYNIRDVMLFRTLSISKAKNKGELASKPSIACTALLIAGEQVYSAGTGKGP